MTRIKKIIDKSQRAVCGITEREVTVPKERVTKTIRLLEASGYHVVGISYGDTRMKKIWFILRSSFL